MTGNSSSFTPNCRLTAEYRTAIVTELIIQATQRPTIVDLAADKFPNDAPEK